jgi:hypothetical protein
VFNLKTSGFPRPQRRDSRASANEYIIHVAHRVKSIGVLFGKNEPEVILDERNIFN